MRDANAPEVRWNCTFVYCLFLRIKRWIFERYLSSEVVQAKVVGVIENVGPRVRACAVAEVCALKYPGDLY